MRKEQLTKAVEAAKTETQNALQTVYDALNNGQRNKIKKDGKVKALLDRYGVKGEE